MIKTIIGLALGSILLALGHPAEAQQPTFVGWVICAVGSRSILSHRRVPQGLSELG